MIIYALKGMGSYARHARLLGEWDDSMGTFTTEVTALGAAEILKFSSHDMPHPITWTDVCVFCYHLFWDQELFPYRYLSCFCCCFVFVLLLFCFVVVVVV